MRTFGLIAGALLALVTVAGAQPAAKPLPWSVNTTYELTVTQPAPKAEALAAGTGEVFDRSDFQAILLLPTSGDLAYVLDLKPQQVLVYPRAGVVGADGEPHPLAAAEGKPLAPFVTEPDGRIVFSDGARHFTLAAAPPLLGPISRAELEARQPGYVRRAKAYRPDPDAISRIATVQRPVEILAFFGTWCLICQHELPAHLATLDAAANPNLTLSLVAVDENVAEPRDLIAQYRVVTTPTMIVLADGQELGRVEEEAKGTVEAALAEILVGPAEGGR